MSSPRWSPGSGIVGRGRLATTTYALQHWFGDLDRMVSGILDTRKAGGIEPRLTDGIQRMRVLG